MNWMKKLFKPARPEDLPLEALLALSGELAGQQEAIKRRRREVAAEIEKRTKKGA